MSKRFGRNQRRKLHERVAQLEIAVCVESDLKSHIRQERDRLSQTLATVERMLGPHFAGLPPKTITVRQSFTRQPIVNIATRAEPVRSFPDPSLPAPVSMRCEYVDARCSTATSTWTPHARVST